MDPKLTAPRRGDSLLSGVILLNKEPGVTSFDCIRALKKKLNRKDLGHGGTLDKFASGLLPVFAGDGLKLARFFLENHPTLSVHWKTYVGTFEFGKSTTTGDPEGDPLETKPIPRGLTLEQVAAAMQSFVDDPYEQMPPRFSAKKIGGERASDLARAGLEPDLKPVLVTVRRFKCLKIDGPFVDFEVECSKGTYVRSLAQDLAKKLDTVGHVVKLTRTAVGEFRAQDAQTIDAVDPHVDSVLSMSQAASFLPSFEISRGEVDHLRVGKVDGILARLSNSGLPPSAYCVRAEETKQPLALLELNADKHARFLRALTFCNAVS